MPHPESDDDRAAGAGIPLPAGFRPQQLILRRDAYGHAAGHAGHMVVTVRRIAGILLLLADPVAAGAAGLTGFFATAVLTDDLRLLCLAGLAAAIVIAAALAVPGWALLRRRHARRYAAGFATAVVIVWATSFSIAVLVPGPRPAAGPAPSWVRFWVLPTGSRIAYAHRGALGRPHPYPVVFLHGGPGTPGEGLPTVADSLAADGFDVYAYDQVGAGRSSRLRDVTDYTVARQVTDLDAIRTVLGADRLILVGQSWGGSLAAQYLAAHPARVHKAVFTSPGPIWPSAWPDGGTGDPWTRMPARQRQDRDAVLARPRILALAALQQVNPNAAHHLVGDDEADELLHRIAVLGKDATTCPGAPPPTVHGNHQGFYVNQLTTDDFATIADPRPALRTVSVPALVMRGTCDFVPWPVTREYRDMLTDATLVAIPGAGHGIAAGQPTLYAETLRAFLAGRPLPLPPWTDAAAPSP